MARNSRRRVLTLAGAAIMAPALGRRAFADAWPKDKIIRAVVPFAAGSTIDIIARIVLDPLSTQLGQTVVVENRGGAGGAIGSAAVAKSEPDGYTLLINASAHSAAPAVYPNLTYDPSKDFAGVAVFGVVPNVLLLAPSKGIKTVRELVERASGGAMTFASAGVGSATHWAAERFLLSAGVKATHVPFSGGPAALTEVMSGRVDFCFIGISSAMSFIADGRLLPLAVSTRKRSPALPNVPTTLEAGRLRLQLLERDVGAGEDPATHHRTIARRGAESAGAPRRTDKARPTGGRTDAACPARVRCPDREGDRLEHQSCQSRGAEVLEHFSFRLNLRGHCRA